MKNSRNQLIIFSSIAKLNQVLRNETANLVTLTQEILNEKLHFLCNVTIFFAAKVFLNALKYTYFYLKN